MTKYTDGIRVVEAHQWEGPWQDLPEVLVETIGDPTNKMMGVEVRFYVESVGGVRVRIYPRDWIITEGGYNIPCDEKVFASRFTRFSRVD